MTTRTRTGGKASAPGALIATRPLIMPTAEQVRRNLATICRDQIIGAAKAGDEERLDYWLARYVALNGKEASA
ncbi:MAG: hypothetical protein J2P38_07855 [Candidatus Dormibacteraeota bacterium]|nr:hypothetical protein [Candidatus Dormibacteraeota bacterium]